MKMFDLTTDPVAVVLADALAKRRSIMIHSLSRSGRSHLKVHQDRGGYFVRTGRNGGCKERLGRCQITYLDGRPTLYQFTLKSRDDFDADQQRRFDERHGIASA